MEMVYRSDNQIIQSEPKLVELVRKVNWEYLNEIGMLGLFKRSPVHPNEEITLQVFGHSGGVSLQYWWSNVEFDSDVLTFVRATTGSKHFFSFQGTLLEIRSVLGQHFLTNSTKYFCTLPQRNSQNVFYMNNISIESADFLFLQEKKN